MGATLITGLSGFAGGHLAEHLAATTDQPLVGLSRSPIPPGLRHRLGTRLSSYQVDLRDAERVGETIAAVAPTEVYHLAAIASAAESDRDLVFAINVEGTRHLLAACTQLPLPPRVLAVSSGYVYGACDPQRPALETDPLPPKGNPYLASKQAAEQVAAQFAESLPLLIARPLNHTGPRQSPAFVVPAFAKQIAEIEHGLRPPKLAVGNLEARRDLLDVRDVVRAYRLLMEVGETGETYNVSSGHAVGIDQVLDQLLALSTASLSVVPDPDRQRPSDLPVLVSNSRKLREATGWSPQYDLSQTLTETLDYWRREVSR